MDADTLHKAKSLDWKIHTTQEIIDLLKKPNEIRIGLIQNNSKGLEHLTELDDLHDAIKNDVLEKISAYYEFELCELQEKFDKLK